MRQAGDFCNEFLTQDTKYTVSEVHRRIAGPLADARGSAQSRDHEGAVFPEYATVFAKRGTKLGLCTRAEAQRTY